MVGLAGTNGFALEKALIPEETCVLLISDVLFVELLRIGVFPPA